MYGNVNDVESESDALQLLDATPDSDAARIARLLRLVAELGAECDGLRADLDGVLADLDDLRSDRVSLAERLAMAAADRDRAEHDLNELRHGHTELRHAHTELRRVHDRTVHDDAERLEELRRRNAALTDRWDQAAHAASAHQLGRSEAAVEIYRAELRYQAEVRRADGLAREARLLNDAVVAADQAAFSTAQQSGRIAEELEATRNTVSWRMTRPLRVVRATQRNVAQRLRPRAPVVASAPVDTPAAWTAVRALDPKPPTAELVDPDFYRRRYPDTAHLSDVDVVDHYLDVGRAQGRSPISLLRSSLILAPAVPDERERIVLVAPDDEPTGRSTLSSSVMTALAERYHVVVVRRVDIPATAVATDAGTTVLLRDGRSMGSAEAFLLAIELREMANPTFVVASIDHHELACAFEDAGVPVVGAVDHPPGDGTTTPGAFERFFASVSHLVYPAQGIAAVTTERYLTARGRGSTVAAFGQPERVADLVDNLGRHAATIRATHDDVLRTIIVPGGFDPELFAGGIQGISPEHLGQWYLRRVQAAAPVSAAFTGRLVQRPRPGFHPLAYAESAPGFVDDGSDPLAHFLRAGQPAGRWAKRIITPAAPAVWSPAGGPTPTVLVHGHFHYPEVLDDFLVMLAGNQTALTLVLTTTSAGSADDLRSVCDRHPVAEQAIVTVVPNRGRNLSALLSTSVADLVAQHDLVLHVHGKRSPHLDPEVGERWRRFLWAHLVGDGFAFADQIVAEFAGNPRLGLVAAEDRILADWDLNAHHVPGLLSRLGRSMDVPVHFDFPLGAMFWARSAALAPFVGAGLASDVYPPEPVDPDGTMLHALERLIPLVIEHDGFEFAKTHLAGVHR